MLILVINSGSSSIKYQLFDIPGELLCKGLIERIGQDKSNLVQQKIGSESVKKQISVKDHQGGIKVMVDAISDTKYGVIDSICKIAAIGHRVVRGGEEFKESTLITPEVIKYIEKYCE